MYRSVMPPDAWSHKGRSHRQVPGFVPPPADEFPIGIFFFHPVMSMALVAAKICSGDQAGDMIEMI
jgi:hypothetical protein